MRTIFLSIGCLLAILLPTACSPADLVPDTSEYLNVADGYAMSSGVIRQWTPVNLAIMVHDREGQDLLSPDRQGNYFEGATLRFQGQTYTAQEELGGTSMPKSYLPAIYGYILVHTETGYCLLFGEIDGGADLDENITLSWRDGSKDIIHYYCANHNPKDMTCRRSWKLNGKSVNGPSFTLIK